MNQQEGLANVCLVGRAVTLVRAKIEVNLPRKRGAAAAGYEKAVSRFYEKVLLKLAVPIVASQAWLQETALRAVSFLHTSEQTDP